MGSHLYLIPLFKGLEGRNDTLIVNMSSIFAHYKQVPNCAIYQATKAAIKAITDTASRESYEKGSLTRIVMLSSGIVATEFREKATSGASEFQTYFSEFPPLTPADISDALSYVMSTPSHVAVHDIMLAPMGQGL